MSRCTCAGDPDRPCPWCARRIARQPSQAELDSTTAFDTGWQPEQDRYERWLAEIAP